MKQWNKKEITLDRHDDVYALFGVIFGLIKLSGRDGPFGDEFGF